MKTPGNDTSEAGRGFGRRGWMCLRRPWGLAAAIVFLVVGKIFLRPCGFFALRRVEDYGRADFFLVSGMDGACDRSKLG
jgi:hypothetical protein